MADKQTVKVGDRITAKFHDSCNDYRAGNTFYVQGVEEDGGEPIVVFTDNVGDKRYRRVSEFTVEHAPVAGATGKPAFKVGDRVVALKDSAYRIKKGSISTVIRVDGDHISIRKENGEADGWLAEYFALAPLTIETGKFYLTRDGRKVGPIDHNGFGVYGAPEYPDHWYENGLSYSDNTHSPTDLIAEWVDEPASNDNQPVAEQQAGTVFIDVSKAGLSQLHLAKGRLVKVNQGFGFELARYGNYVWVDTGKKQPVVAHINEIKEAA